jgi:hypothetical protein
VTQEALAKAGQSLAVIVFLDLDQTANPQAEVLKAFPSKRQTTDVVTES